MVFFSSPVMSSRSADLRCLASAMKADGYYKEPLIMFTVVLSLVRMASAVALNLSDTGLSASLSRTN